MKELGVRTEVRRLVAVAQPRDLITWFWDNLRLRLLLGGLE